MPNVISASKRRLTYLENRHVATWLEKVARERQTDVAVLVREATSSYFAAHQAGPAHETFSKRAAQKASQRRATARQIAQGTLTPTQAQRRNAPFPADAPVRMVDLWSSVQRRRAKH